MSEAGSAPAPHAAGTLVLAGDAAVEVEAIMAAVRARAGRRRAQGVPVPAREVEERLEERALALDAWNLPRATWAAMWPPRLTPWNLDEDYPIRSHRGRLAPLLVALKRAWRAALLLVARPLVAQQAEVNRALALQTQALARDEALARAHAAALERRVARVTELLRETRGDAPPLLVFADEAEGKAAPA